MVGDYLKKLRRPTKFTFTKYIVIINIVLSFLIWYKINIDGAGLVFSHKLRYIVGFGLVEMAISTNPKPTIYRNLYENTRPDSVSCSLEILELM